MKVHWGVCKKYFTFSYNVLRYLICVLLCYGFVYLACGLLQSITIAPSPLFSLGLLNAWNLVLSFTSGGGVEKALGKTVQTEKKTCWILVYLLSSISSSGSNEKVDSFLHSLVVAFLVYSHFQQCSREIYRESQLWCANW